jgi:CubicO group peptidase (beta-lactamase class C family)
MNEILTRKIMAGALAILVACLPAGPLAAAMQYQRPAGVADADEPLIAAGYRALFTCSAHFFAGRPLSDILKVELVDTRKHRFPDPVIDEARQLVTAEDADGNTRIAAFRDSMGCTVLPPHQSAADIPRLPYVAYAELPTGDEQPFPAGDRVDLDERGTHPDFTRLRPALERAFDGGTYGEGTVTISAIVLSGDRIVAERYRPGFGIHTGYRTWSTAKSISAAVLGIAAHQGLLDLNDPAAVPEWQYPGDARAAITYKHLLWMSSGLEGGGNNTYAVYFGGQDAVSAVTTTALEADPGSRWKYANNDTLLYLRALRHVLGDDLRYLRFPYDELLHRIGMYHTRMEVDHRGNFIGSSQVYTTSRDLARFGLLLAKDGVWNGERLLPEGWVAFSATPAPARPPVDGEWGYGAQFWLLDRMPGVPDGTFTTAGNKGQYVTVVPGHDLVIVRTGVDPEGKSFAQDQWVAEIVSLLE